MKIKLAILILLIITISCNKNRRIIQQVYYVDDVRVVEYLTINFCVDKNGKSESVKVVPTKTNYKNKARIEEILKLNREIEYHKENKLNGNCFEYSFQFVNEKYKNKSLSINECEKSEIFKTGNFEYISILLPNYEIIRNDSIQIEKNADSESIYKIEWQSPCEYSLTYTKVNGKKSEYLIGESIKVKIIDILPSGDYVYKSNLLDRTLSTGIMRKLK